MELLEINISIHVGQQIDLMVCQTGLIQQLRAILLTHRLPH